ncbi:MAG: TIGR00730 family Rossman fold protein [Bacteroidales bacterium]|nr:TIGR00730 family Rossman fold protein [Bacteroidales bacterium]
MKSIAVFCGSSSGSNEIYREKAIDLGKTLANNDIRLVYGGARVGLMGAIADAVLEAGGDVIGVIPGFLQTSEVAHENLSELIRVETMHERKARVYELSDGAIALPGGFGTMDELFEMLTWGQLGIHEKPVGLLNINGFFDDLSRVIINMVNEGFLKELNSEMVIISEEIEELLDRMKKYQAPAVSKWIFKKAE